MLKYVYKLAIIAIVFNSCLSSYSQDAQTEKKRSKVKNPTEANDKSCKGKCCIVKKGHTLTYVFNTEGQLLKIEGLDKDYLKKKKRLTIKFKIVKQGDFLSQQYFGLFNKYLSAFKNLGDEQNAKALNKFGIDTAAIDTIKRAYLKQLYIYNKEFGYKANLKLLGDTIADKDILSLNDNPYTVFFTYESNGNVKTENKNISELGTATLLIEDVNCTKFEYQLRFQDPNIKYLMDTLKLHIKNKPEKSEHENAVDSLGKLSFDTTTLESIISKLKEYSITNKNDSLLKIDALCSSLDNKTIKIPDPVITYFKSNKKWVTAWLWYTGGIPKLDPFNEDKNAINITLAYETLESLKKKQSVWDNPSLVKDPGINLINYADKAQEIKGQVLKQQRIVDSLSKLSVKHSDVLLYEGVIKFNGGCRLSENGKKYHRIHDADHNFDYMNRVKSNYDEDSELMIQVENSKNELGFSFSKTNLKEKTILASELERSLDVLNAVITDLPKNKAVESDNSLENCKKKEKLINAYVDYKWYQENLKYPEGYVFYYTQSQTPIRQTEVKTLSLEDTASYILKYHLKQTKAIKDSTTFQIRSNKLYRFWPAAGPSYTWAEHPEVLIDGNNGKLNATYFNGLKLVVGIKIYPWKAPVYDPYFFISNKRHPHFDIRKLHVFTGVNVANITKEFVLGAGLDLWSGLSIHGGSYIIHKKQEEFVNGSPRTINRYLDWENWYLGINMDVSVVVKAVRFLGL